MIKALFIVGQCIRLLHTDPWQGDTFKVNEVGKYSYHVSVVLRYYDNDADPILFKDQKKYFVVDCPKQVK